MKKSIWISVFLILGLVSSQAFAGATVSCEKKAENKLKRNKRVTFDYGDAATASGDSANAYGVACHDTPKWQRLGSKWDVDNVNTVEAGSDDSTDDGVNWRTSSDGGVSWTDFGTTADVTQGDLVEFQFEFTRIEKGNHQFDELKAWVDWDQDVNWNNDDEVIQHVRWYKDQDATDTEDRNGTWHNKDLSNVYGEAVYNNTDTQRTYTQLIEVPLDAALGETWLRARVVCENSLRSYSPGLVMDATGYQHQGEVEDYALTVLAKRSEPPVSVPEPAGILLLSSGLFVLMARRKNV